MKDCKKIMFGFLALVFLCSPAALNSQALANDSLDLEALMKIAIEKNYFIKIAKAEKMVADNNSSMGNAGLLPEIAVDGGADYSLNNTNITFASPQQPEINATNAATQSLNAGLGLNYTLYSGGSNRYIYRQLKEGSYQQNLKFRSQIESTILELLQNYLSYLLQKEAYLLDQKAVDISIDRLQRAENKFSFGAFTKLEVLNAEVDLRNDSTSLIQSKISHQKAYRDLLGSLSLPPDSNILIKSPFEIEEKLEFSTIEESAFQKNANYLLSESVVRTQELQLKISKSRWLPQLNLSAAYRYTYQNNEAGFIQSQENYGFNGGLSLRYPLFQGGNRSRQQQNQKILLEAEADRLEQSKIDLETNLMNAYDDYEAALSLMGLAERNIVATKQNYERSEEAYSKGQIDGIQLREAQLNYLNSLYFHQLQRVQAKIAEASLHFLSGTLVQ